MSDICLTDQDAVLAGHRINCVAHDIVLEGGPDRREVEGGVRRALVHDFNDGLTLNWEEDYPGGVTIRGRVRVPERLSVDSLELRVSRGPLRPRRVDLGEALEDMRQQIRDLEQRVAEFEGGTP